MPKIALKQLTMHQAESVTRCPLTQSKPGIRYEAFS